MRLVDFRYLVLAAALGFAIATTAESAEPSLGAAVKQLDRKYLDVPEIATEDDSPKIVVGGYEEGVEPTEQEISLGPVRVTLTYIDEEPPEEAEETPADDMPDEAGEAPAAESATEDEPAPALEDIPEEAILPGEIGVGETVWRAPVVTVYLESGTEPDMGDASGTGVTGGEVNATNEAAADGASPAGPRVVAKLQGESAGFADPPVSVQIAELDPNNPYPEVVVSFYTGGAHCCSVTSVITSNAEGSEWTTVDVGEFDGGPMLAVDLDGDGTYEFETRDNAFLYAFACYACSEAPLQVLALKGDKIEDMSGDARFKTAHAAWLKTMIVGVPEEEVNGFLAGYVAQKIRLGEGKDAWDLMLKYYDRNTDWGLEACDQDLDERGECPGEMTKVTFPEALELMLKENGYMLEN
ncbi:MAG: hypothetical protein ACRECX_04950 [Methyloceanibacter sp.]|uniref:hypothetical protein n=1 Tax=Methyloceanibacter sp. TaxID=1965321 RepID=UPI003D6D956B